MGKPVTISSGTVGTVRWAIQAQDAALDFLLPKNRNEVIRQSMVGAGEAWIAMFLPKRFSDYVDRAPFPYPSHRLGFYLGKAKRMGIVKGICERLLMGWDPWSSSMPPATLITQWKAQHPGKYKRAFAVLSTGLVADLRANSKRRVMEVIDEMWGDGKFVPLVESGRARGVATSGARASATATATRQTLRIAVPFGRALNGTVGAVVRTVPKWEVASIAKNVGRGIADRLAKRGLSVNQRTGVVTTRTAPVAQARGSDTAVPRA